jgi:hypothetical protein
MSIQSISQNIEIKYYEIMSRRVQKQRQKLTPMAVLTA